MSASSEAKEFGRVLFLLLVGVLGLGVVPGHYWLKEDAPPIAVIVFSLVLIALAAWGLKVTDLTGFVSLAGRAWREYKGAPQ